VVKDLLAQARPKPGPFGQAQQAAETH